VLQQEINTHYNEEENQELERIKKHVPVTFNIFGISITYSYHLDGPDHWIDNQGKYVKVLGSP
jgi:hypothetical protein